MTLSNRYTVACLALLVGLLFSSCEATNSDSYANDPYGIKEAEELGGEGQPDRLVQCSKDEQCPEYAEALFWVAVDILSDASTETIEVEGIDFGLTKGMSIEEMAEKIVLQLDSSFDNSPLDFSKDKTGFNRGFVMLLKAHNAKSVYAANELGKLYMEQEGIKDLDIAQMYFESAIKRGDFLGAYNLARLIRIRKPNDNRSILKYLKMATKTGDERIEIAYNLGLEAFGTEAEKQTAALYFKENTIVANYITENFKSDFSLQQQE
ncbi:MAG: hypothetical protein L3J04_02870 [Robiginitomaculum sp.]|nr:hypothetical protein [Robiginitomaculum sp.]